MVVSYYTFKIKATTISLFVPCIVPSCASVCNKNCPAQTHCLQQSRHRQCTDPGLSI